MVDISDLISRLSFPRPGGVILFTGAGFSDGATNADGKKIPLAKGISRLLCDQLSISEDLPLTLAAELFNEKNNSDRAFIDILIHNYSVKHRSAYYTPIGKYPWKRIYTTNYDNLFEFICPNKASLNRNEVPYALESGGQIIHLNGSIGHVTKSASIDDFQLTLSHYFERDLFNTPWASTFRSDLELAHTIVFAGYSMYDSDISKILFSDKSLQGKTFVIQRTDLPAHEDRFLSRFGTVLKIGISGLADEVEKVLSAGGPVVSTVYPENFDEYATPTPDPVSFVGPEQISDLLERGVFSRSVFEASVKPHSATYIVRRQITDEIIKCIDAGNQNILIHADLGNGKTIIAESLFRELSSKWGYRVFIYNGIGESLDYDIRSFSQMHEKFIVFFDGFFYNQREIEIIRSQLSSAFIVVLERTALFDLRKAEIASLFGSTYITFDVNKLTENDINGISRLLDSGAYWASNVKATSSEAKRRIISVDCSSEMSSLTMGIVKSNIHKKEIVSALNILKNDNGDDSLDVICCSLVLSLINCQTYFWLISELIGRDVYTTTMSITNQGVKQFFCINNSMVTSRSPILSEYILKDILDDSYVIGIILKMLGNSSSRFKRSKLYRSINSRLMQFKNIDRVIRSRKNRYDIVNRFYLSAGELGYKEFSPPYWSQYAIAARSFGDFLPADRFFREAQRIGRTRSDYYLYKIDNAYAQFLLESRTLTDHWSDYASVFLEASRIALSQTAIRQAGNYPYKVAALMPALVEQKIAFFSNRDKELVAEECRRWFDHFKNLPRVRLKSKLVADAREAVSYAFDFVQA